MSAADPAGADRLAAVEAELANRWPEQHVAPDLARITLLMELLGDPQRSAPVIMIAGTNGKTSTARMAAALLGAFGLRVGLATSPHLDDVRERIVLDGAPVDVERFLRVHDEVAPLIGLVDERSVAAGGSRMTWFEAVIGLTYACFADAPVDVAVVEVGMGGTWDATNVADAAVAVVTPVGIDHAEYLGDTLEQIASEKAGIIKADGVAVLGRQERDAAEVLLRRCVEVGAPVAREGIEFGVVARDLAVGGQVLSLQGIGGRYDDVFLPLHGAYQAHNAAIALAAVESFLGGGADRLDPQRVVEGFAAVTSPGRLETVRTAPTVLVDAAHNPHGARALADAVAESFGFTALFGVVAVLSDKDARGLLEALEPVLDRIVVTRNSSPRAMAVDDLADLARAVLGDDRVEARPTLLEAIEIAVGWADDVLAREGGGAGVLVTGSVVTAADARRLLRRGGPR